MTPHPLAAPFRIFPVTITDSGGRVTIVRAKAAPGKSPLGRAVSAFIIKKQTFMRKLLPLRRYVAEFNGETDNFSFGRTERGEYAVRIHPELNTIRILREEAK